MTTTTQTNHSATKLDAIFKQYEVMAEQYHHNMVVRGQLALEMRADPNASEKAIAEMESDRNYFLKLHRITVRKMDLVRQLIALEENYPTSAFL